MKGLLALVVDNNVDSCEMMRCALETYGITVQTAAASSQAVEVLQWFQPDIFVIDIVLPDEDGYALLSRIRQIESGKGDNTIAIATTADVTQRHEQSSGAGFAAMLFKPVDIDEVIDLIVRLTRQEENVVG